MSIHRDVLVKLSMTDHRPTRQAAIARVNALTDAEVRSELEGLRPGIVLRLDSEQLLSEVDIVLSRKKEK